MIQTRESFVHILIIFYFSIITLYRIQTHTFLFSFASGIMYLKMCVVMGKGVSDTMVLLYYQRTICDESSLNRLELIG